MKVFRKSIHRWHDVVCRAPKCLVFGYLELLSWVTRGLNLQSLSARVLNSLYEHPWPPLNIPPKSVRVGRGAKIMLVPHLGEYDQEALVS